MDNLINNSRPALVDVPVRMNIWIRPECQKKQWEIIRQARPSILFIQSDGGRNSIEQKIIEENRKMIDSTIDWECVVYRFYEDNNNGLYAMAKKVSAFIWEKVDRCVFIEDDQIMSVSFFRYCAELLELYKDDQRIECICGMNHLGVCSNVTSDYFFSRQGSIWGFATWKRVIDERKNGFDYVNNDYVMTLLKNRTRKNRTIWKRLNAYGRNKYYEGHVAGSEFWFEFDMYFQNRLQIIPKVNLIKNIGFGEDSLHADELEKMPRRLRQVFNMKTYEIKFPMILNNYVIPDTQYEKKRNKIMYYNENKMIGFFRKIGRGFWFLFHDFKGLKKRLKRNNIIEK